MHPPRHRKQHHFNYTPPLDGCYGLFVALFVFVFHYCAPPPSWYFPDAAFETVLPVPPPKTTSVGFLYENLCLCVCHQITSLVTNLSSILHRRRTGNLRRVLGLGGADAGKEPLPQGVLLLVWGHVCQHGGAQRVIPTAQEADKYGAGSSLKPVPSWQSFVVRMLPRGKKITTEQGGTNSTFVFLATQLNRPI